MYLDDCVCVLPDLTLLPLLGVGRKSWYIIIINEGMICISVGMMSIPMLRFSIPTGVMCILAYTICISMGTICNQTPKGIFSMHEGEMCSSAVGTIYIPMHII